VNECHRSFGAYPSLVTDPNGIPIEFLEVTDPAFRYDFLACSGAETTNVRIGGEPQAAGSPDNVTQMERQTVPGGIPVVPTSDLVTITIGGNDSGVVPSAVELREVAAPGQRS